MSEATALEIRNSALELGFDGCGIVSFEALKEYEQILDERIQACPNSKMMLEPLRKYAKLDNNYPWAKAVIVCLSDYSKYAVPEQLQGLIGKYYLYDHKLQPETIGAKRIAAFESKLEQLGVKWAKELHGVTAARLAAAKAGLGITRKNNFFYTEKGCRIIIDTWIIDKELEWVESSQLEPCPDGCSMCVEACPTNALSRPNCTDMASCVTFLTWGARDLIPEEMMKQAGKWIYGCDQCQDVCPMNKKTPKGSEEYPGLCQLAEEISLPAIMAMDENQIREKLLPKFWFIQPENFWLWRVNALRAMTNSYIPEYRDSILNAVEDENDKVREMANKAIGTLLEFNSTIDN